MQDRPRSASVAIFAPRPVSTALWNAPAVDIFAYEPGTGIAAVPSRTMAFAGIDLDLWFRSIAAQLDALLTAELTTAVASLDRVAGTSRSAALQAQRERVASALSGLMSPVTEPAPDDAEVGSVVRQVFRARLLAALGDLYETQAVLAQGTTALALVAGPETVRDATGAVVASAEYDFGDTALGVPLVLRRYPDRPFTAAQSASGDAGGAPAPADAVKRWRYGVTYARAFHDPRDVVIGRVTFGVAPAAGDAAMRRTPLGGDTAAREVFAGLAEFVVVFPDVVVDLQRLLREVTVCAEPDAAVVRDAGAAVDALIALLGGIDVPPADALAPADTANGAFDVELTLAERAANDGRLVVTLSLANGGGIAADAITVHVGDATAYVTEALSANAGASQRAFVYARAGTEPAEYLTAANGQTVAERTVEIAGLDAFAQPNARAAFAVRRNGSLAEPYVYRTPDVPFGVPAAPSLDAQAPVVLDAPPQPIAAHLGAFFADLLNGAVVDTVVIGAEIAYVYDDANESGFPAVVVPVVMQPPATVALRGDGAGLALDGVLAAWQDALVTWFADIVPPGGGTLRFDLSFATVTETPAQVRLHDVQIPLAAIEPPLLVAELA